jgi:hemerythrin superfamily protein/uncharacterized protein (DUF2249 family)
MNMSQPLDHEPALVEAPRVLDLRRVAVADHGHLFLTAFDRLMPGRSLVLVTATARHDLLERLQTIRKGVFEWWPLEESQGSWQVEVIRRKAEPGARRALAEALGEDHHRLSSSERLAFACLDAGDVDSARHHWRTFHRGVNRHIQIEEELLFPVFDAKSRGGRTGPTSVLRAEHREIRMLLEEIARALGSPSSEVQELRGELQKTLGDHVRKEESILYPAMDTLLGEAERDGLVARVQQFPS